MSELERWLEVKPNWGAAKSAKFAKSAQDPQETAENRLATLSNPSAKSKPLENCQKHPHLADLADLAGGVLSHEQSAWDVEGWKAFYEERAAIGEFDAGLPKAHAEHMAFEQCICHWLALKPPQAGEQGCCLYCGQPAGPDAIPTTCATEVPGLIHHECRDEWGEQRRAQAATALAKFGVEE